MVTNTDITDTGGIIPCPKCLNIYNRVNGRTLVINFGIINGFEVYSSTENIPDEPLYIMLSAGIQKDAEPQELPSNFEIDWVRCYEKAN